MLMSVLHVAQKNSIAKQVANILSNSTKRIIPTLSKYNPIFQFNLDGKNMKFTSVRGHIFDYQLPEECKNWNTYDNRKILSSEAPMVKKLGKDMDDLVKNLDRLAQTSQELILWLDCDREGEAIAFQVIQICKKKNPHLKIQRARFSAVTPQDIWTAYNNLVRPNQLEADAVNYRIQVDFRLGCTFTRYQTISFNKIYRLVDKSVVSYGPCQMPTLNFVVNRYLQIKNFKPQKFWFIEAICVIDDNTGIPFNWCKKNTRNEHLANETMLKMISKYENSEVVGEVKDKKNNQKKKYRPYPLITVKFQKLVTDKLKMSSAQAMDIAEKLYQKGFISYPRTQTNAFPKTMNLKSMLQKIKGSNNHYDEYIEKLLNEGKFMNPKVGNKDDQAHSPIHPVKAASQDSLAPLEWKVYDLISRHFLACCSKDAFGQEFQVRADIGGQQFKASYLTVIERNYLQIYPFQRWVETSFPAQIPNKFPVMLTMKDGKTTPPSYLSESDLIDLMEKNQIGTDSTIHQHIQTIQKRHYAIKSNNTFKPTDLGSALVQAYGKFQIQLPQCEIRRTIEQNMAKISSGELRRSHAVRQTLDSMIPIYERLTEIKQAWLRAMKQIIQNSTDIPKMCNSINEHPQNDSRVRQNRQENDNTNNQGYSSSIRCYKCGEPGHIAPDCPNNNPPHQNNKKLKQNYQSDRNVDNSRSNYESSRNNSTKNCYKCGKEGHYANNCTNKQKKVSTNFSNSKQDNKKSYKCFACGQEGHFAPNCPNKNNDKTYQKNNNFEKKKVQKKVCPQCGHEGRHPKLSTCSLVKRKNNTKSVD